jgi:chromosome segregation ATPase
VLRDAEDPGHISFEKELGAVRERITAQDKKIRFLEEKRHDLASKLKDLKTRLREIEKRDAALKQAGGLRRRLRQWLMRP